MNLNLNVGLGLVKQGFVHVWDKVRDNDEPLVMGELRLQINCTRITACQTPILYLCLCVFVTNCVTIIFILAELNCICAQDPILRCQTKPNPSFLPSHSLLLRTRRNRLSAKSWLSIDSLSEYFQVRVHVWSSRSIHPLARSVQLNYSLHTKCWPSLCKSLQH